MSLVIASQLDPGFNDRLRSHAAAPTVIDVPEDEPWAAANDADILLVIPSQAWRGNRHRERPGAWPGRLQWIYSASVGVDFYPHWLLDAPLVSCGRGVASEPIADYVIAALYRQAVDIDAMRVHDPVEWRPRRLERVAGSTVGIVGLGAIGSAVARRALALGTRVVAVRRRDLPSPVEGIELLDDLATLVAESDHIVLALPGTDATRNIIDAAILHHARPHAHIINVARGSVLDQAALIAALDEDRLGFATLDVTEPMPLPEGHALWTHAKVLLTPHIASHHVAGRSALFDKVAANLDRFVRGETPGDLVDRAAGY
jgi:phosphoglycerate dehydrogenase-like enzyme